MPIDDPGFYRTSRADWWLIGLFIALAVTSIVWITGRGAVSLARPAVAMVYQESRLLERIDLAVDGIRPILAGRMHLEVRGRKLRMLDSDCPQHICVHTGWIEHAGQTIVCVPNRVLVEIRSAGPRVVDAVAR